MCYYDSDDKKQKGKGIKMEQITQVAAKPPKTKNFFERCWRQKDLILMSAPAVIILILFSYLPMYGIQIAFRNYFFGAYVDAEWVGLEWFKTFFGGPYFFRLLKNTLLLGIYGLLWGFPAPIILALLLNEVKGQKYKKTVQTISYLPHFISTVIIVSMIKQFTSLDGGINAVLQVMGFEPKNFFVEAKYFRTLFIASSIWQNIGWNSIIYLAALSGVDVHLYEAATIDGAGRFKQLLNVTLPAIMPTVCIMLILNVGSIMGSDYQKVMLMYSPTTYDVADIIGSYTYREGVENGQYSYTTAVGLFNSVISMILILGTNYISKKTTDNSIW